MSRQKPSTQSPVAFVRSALAAFAGFAALLTILAVVPQSYEREPAKRKSTSSSQYSASRKGGMSDMGHKLGAGGGADPSIARREFASSGGTQRGPKSVTITLLPLRIAIALGAGACLIICVIRGIQAMLSTLPKPDLTRDLPSVPRL